MQYLTLNVLGTDLQSCCHDPITGWYRDGYCRTDSQDQGSHTVCIRVTQPFLDFSISIGNDLSTTRTEYSFPGLKPGDKWCLCAARWKEAYDEGKAPKVLLEATHERTLAIVSIDQLIEHSVRN